MNRIVIGNANGSSEEEYNLLYAKQLEDNIQRLIQIYTKVTFGGFPNKNYTLSKTILKKILESYEKLAYYACDDTLIEIDWLYLRAEWSSWIATQSHYN